MANRRAKETIDEKVWSANLDDILQRDHKFLEEIGRL